MAIKVRWALLDPRTFKSMGFIRRLSGLIRPKKIANVALDSIGGEVKRKAGTCGRVARAPCEAMPVNRLFPMISNWGSPDLVDKGGGMREKEHKYGNE